MDLRQIDLHGKYLREIDLRGSDLTGANVTDTNLQDADLRQAKISVEQLRGASNACLAVLDEEQLKLLGLPSDHLERMQGERLQGLQP
jgi:uncharacterized protein YjbI with pentapeptide repeats